MVGLCNYHLSHLSAQGKILILFPLGLLSERAGLGPCFPSGSDTSGYHTIYIPPFLCHQLLHEVGVSFSSCGGSVSCAHDDLCWDWSALILGFLFFLLRISHVRDFITKYQGSEGSVPFTLTTSLPVQELQDETLTLEEAKLQNAVVVQRLRKTTEPFRLLVIKAPDNDYKTAATPNGQLKNEQKNAIKNTRSN